MSGPLSPRLVALVPVGPRTTSPDLLSVGRATYVVVLALTSTSDPSSRLRRIRHLSCHRTQIRAGLYLGCVLHVQYLCWVERSIEKIVV
jgi:hypothetical protein